MLVWQKLSKKPTAKNLAKIFYKQPKTFMSKNLDNLLGDQFIKINGVVMSGITKCPGMFGKNFQDMSSNELIDCIHFSYSRMIKLQDEFNDIKKQYDDLMILLEPILTKI